MHRAVGAVVHHHLARLRRTGVVSRGAAVVAHRVAEALEGDRHAGERALAVHGIGERNRGRQVAARGVGNDGERVRARVAGRVQPALAVLLGHRQAEAAGEVGGAAGARLQQFVRVAHVVGVGGQVAQAEARGALALAGHDRELARIEVRDEVDGRLVQQCHRVRVAAGGGELARAGAQRAAGQHARHRRRHGRGQDAEEGDDEQQFQEREPGFFHLPRFVMSSSVFIDPSAPALRTSRKPPSTTRSWNSLPQPSCVGFFGSSRGRMPSAELLRSSTELG